MYDVVQLASMPRSYRRSVAPALAARTASATDIQYFDQKSNFVC
jgi:hypothetical protein